MGVIIAQLPYIVALLVLGEILHEVATQQCGGGAAEYSTTGMMLQGHIYKTMSVSLGHECLQACYDDVRCQSFNYVISKSMCEFNNRIKEANPEDFVSDSDRYYFRRDKNRGKLKMISSPYCAISALQCFGVSNEIM